jgi:hypothetical protein
MEGKKDDGRIVRWHQMHQFSAEENDAIKKLKGLTRITSTQLAVVSDYHLGPATLDNIRQHLDLSDEKSKAIETRKNDKNRILIEKYLPAREKTINTPFGI